MLPIRTLPPLAMSGPAPRAAAGAGAQFTVGIDPAAGGPVPAGAGEVSLEGMLALQEADGALAREGHATRDRKARRRGRALLEALAGLQRGLLAEGAAVDTLRRLAQLAAEPEEAADPALGLILAQILLRARVELARYDFV